MDKKVTFKVSISGPGVDIKDQEIDAMQFARIIPIIHTPSAGTSPEFTPPASSQLPQLSPREYLNKVGAKTNPQKITIFALYLRDYLDYRTVSPDDLKIQFERAAEPVPKNFSRDLSVAIQLGWLTESHEEPGKYFITASGEKAATSGLRERTGGSKKTSRGKRKFSPTEVRESIKKFDIEASMGGIDYWKQPTKGEKILWLLAYAKSKGINQLNYKELSELAEKLGDHIPVGNISSLIEKHKREGRLITPLEGETRMLKILDPGIEYFKKS